MADTSVTLEKLTPVAKPDKDALDATLATLNADIKVLQKKMDAAEAKIKGLFDSTKGTRTKRSEARDKAAAIRAERKKLMDEKKRILDARDEFQKTLADMRDAGKKMRNQIKYRNVEDIDKAIERLERRQATSSMSLSDEKNLLKEMNQLKTARKTLENFSKTHADSEGHKVAVRGLGEQLTAVKNALSEVNKRLDAQMVIVKSHESELDAAHKDEVPALKKKKMDIKKQIDAKYTELRKIRSDYYDQNKKFREYMKKRNELRQEQRKAEQKAWEAKKAEERRLADEAEEKQKPWMEEIATCDILINYLNGLKPKTKSAKTEEASTEETGSSSAGLDGLELMPKKGADINIGVKGKRGKKLRKKKKKPAVTSLTHSLDTFDDFKKIGLSAPLEQSDIDACLEELQKKRNYWDTKPRVLKKVKTPYGPGKVLKTREDGVKVVEMNWTLAEGAKVFSYMQAVDCKY